MKHRNLLCPLCPDKFFREQNLVIHIVNKHDKSHSEAKAILSSTLNILEEVKDAIPNTQARGPDPASGKP